MLRHTSQASKRTSHASITFEPAFEKKEHANPSCTATRHDGGWGIAAKPGHALTRQPAAAPAQGISDTFLTVVLVVVRDPLLVFGKKWCQPMNGQLHPMAGRVGDSPVVHVKNTLLEPCPTNPLLNTHEKMLPVFKSTFADDTPVVNLCKHTHRPSPQKLLEVRTHTTHLPSVLFPPGPPPTLLCAVMRVRDRLLHALGQKSVRIEAHCVTPLIDGQNFDLFLRVLRASPSQKNNDK